MEAIMTKNAWGSWALDADRAEAEEKERASAGEASVAFAPLPGADAQIFPSLKEASTNKGRKKKKNVTLSLSQFTTGAYVGYGGYSGRDNASSHAVEPKGLTPGEIFHLPTGPRERSEEEIQHARGFRSYGYGGGGPCDGGSRRSYGDRLDDEARRSAPEFDQPSRADEVDNWAAGKKSSIHLDSAARRDRYSSGIGMDACPSRADEADNWAAGKKPFSSRQTGFGFGVGSRSSQSTSDTDRWFRGNFPYNGEQRESERRRLVLDPPKAATEIARPADQAEGRPSPFGAARPREEVLAEKGVDWKKLDTDIEFKKTSSGHIGAPSSHLSSARSSTPGSPRSQAGSVEAAVPVPGTKPKANPFGDAKPREVLLQEKGKDWRKMDIELEHRRVHRLETEEEKTLKEEIEHMKKALAREADGTLNHDSGEKRLVLEEQITQRERDLEMLVQEFDDKIRFGQKATGDVRPGSGAGRLTSLDRPPSHSSRSDDSRNTEINGRPQSRGSRQDIWARPVDRCGFFSNRMERSDSGERW